MDEQELKNIPEGNVEQPVEQLTNESVEQSEASKNETGGITPVETNEGANTAKETNTAKIVWMVVMIVSFVLSITLFVMGIIGIFVSLGLLMLPIVGVFGIIFTILCFVGAVLFLGLGIGSIFGVVRSGKKDTNGAE